MEIQVTQKCQQNFDFSGTLELLQKLCIYPTNAVFCINASVKVISEKICAPNLWGDTFFECLDIHRSRIFLKWGIVKVM